jgi:hypothetical protein
MTRRRTTISTRCTTAPRSSALNTSAFLEAAVVGKPVHTVLVDDISKHNQEGTIHFHYLLDVNGGLLRVARNARRACAACWPDRWRRKAAATSKRIASSKGSSGRSACQWRPRRAFATPREARRSPCRPSVGDGVAERALRLALYPAVGTCSCSCDAAASKRCACSVASGTRTAGGGLRELKQFAQNQLGEKELTAAPLGPPSALTPKPGRQRDPGEEARGLEPAGGGRDARADHALGRAAGRF